MNYSMKLAVLVIFLFIPGQSIISPVQPSPVNTSLTAGEFRPMEPVEYRLIGRKGENHDDDLWRRRLAPFQLCLLCKCCTGPQPPTVPPCLAASASIANFRTSLMGFVLLYLKPAIVPLVLLSSSCFSYASSPWLNA
ncbi:hypothetical protein IMY05_006G0094200 [Salix suchowensis]|nr:hypothetical protein IMY05_006G0094200 [Salix suchowensis]